MVYERGCDRSEEGWISGGSVWGGRGGSFRLSNEVYVRNISDDIRRNDRLLVRCGVRRVHEMINDESRECR